jgi:lysyl-tRNA synthetase class 2
VPEHKQAQWKPACDIEHLLLRAAVLSAIRTFFEQRSVLEVETPLLCHATGTDPQLDFFSSYYHCVPNERGIKDKEMFLQTSPEFAMKRLLAAGSGSIFQICKAFRNGESGRLHNPEFSILEWYRVGFSLEQLMDEVAELLVQLMQGYCHIEPVHRFSYQELFKQVTGLNPLIFCHKSYAHYASENAMSDAISICENDHAMWLDLLFSFKVQPVLADKQISMVYGYPAVQSSLARINQKNALIADRFEVFINGVEIGNGFFELSDVQEQEQRFDQEISSRIAKGLPVVEKDKLFLAALQSGLPECSGIALGLDRLLMTMANVETLNDVMVFPFDKA